MTVLMCFLFLPFYNFMIIDSLNSNIFVIHKIVFFSLDYIDNNHLGGWTVAGIGAFVTASGCDGPV